MFGIRAGLPFTILIAGLVAGCGREGEEDISGTYAEVEALNVPTIVELQPDGSGKFVLRAGAGTIEDPFLWEHEKGNDYTANYYDDANELKATEQFTYDDGELVFDDEGGVARYARVEDIQAVPTEAPEAPVNLFQ